MIVLVPRDLGLSVRSARVARGLTQEELAGRVGVSRQWVVSLETGRSNPTLKLVLRVLQEVGLELALDEPAGEQANLFDLDAILAETHEGGRD